jgi:hypothetical protein
MPKKTDAQTKCLELCAEIEKHVRLARDYATTPDNVWLARSEISKVNTLVSDLETVVDQIVAEKEV